ncbi:flagellar GTP-binding protein [Opitutus sp. ER46]|uniref:flagellar biosynthesis protein FlhF n=1 Tax=Opitutus sp. ER46 TaxID=2161864 RepID=UPI000D30A248|nr:flagellar GTP-binding protein [Opitutus sp. ER46]PTX90914.1 flagellar GTP-binding protein [Opitutus sp. ER46]
MADPRPTLAPGAYKFTVKTADEAVALIREKLGPNARVLSVRSIEASGIKRLFSSPRLEVVAQVDAAPATPATPSRLHGLSDEAALPPDSIEDFIPPARRLPTPPPAAAAPEDDTDSTSPRRAPARDDSRISPPLGLSGLLRRSGLTETALNRLQARANWAELNTLPLHRALAETSRLLREQADTRPQRPPLSRAAFLGTSGVGRTTALCKWIAQEVFRRGRLGHVVSVEFDRPNPLGPLPVFAEALGVPLAHFPCETHAAVPGGFVYFDLPGLSVQRPADNAPIGAFLDREQITERVLVLNAAYDRASMRDAYAAGRDLGATHVVFTHLDEVPQWGKLWDYLFDTEVEPLFLATGPSLTGDCEEDVPGAIVRRTLPQEES